ncbi:MAG: ligase-associated DNA damage response exonuclease [Alphaproteobacteria bacterium]|nr:ligase-associated DNA damage response exonuclease [Alphaproteobacteria bacterium]
MPPPSATPPLLVQRPAGLYVPAADLHIDPVRPVERAVITHGHGDHARPGHGAVLATPETLAIMAVRYGPDHAGATQPLPYGRSLDLGAVRLRLVPAGHVIGSAQIVLDSGGMRAVVSGDYKRAPDPTTPPFEPVPCDLFVTEATFGLPVFRHPPIGHELARLAASRAAFPDRPHLIGAYALGKAQRLIASLRESGEAGPIYLHGALERLCALYTELGVELGPLRPLREAGAADLAGALVLAPPSALGDRWQRRLGDPVTGLASGWMRVRARARQRNVELPLVISDHADWDELTATIAEIAPARLWVTHGQEEALVHWARGLGIDAEPLSLQGYTDEGDGAGETEAPA